MKFESSAQSRGTQRKLWATCLVAAACSIIFSQSTLSQSVLLKEKENAIFIFGGVGSGDKVTVFNLGIGGTYNARFDLGASMGFIVPGDIPPFLLNQAFSVLLVKERLPWSSIFLSIDQSFNIVGSHEALSLGGSFTHKLRAGKRNSFLYSFGAHRLIALDTATESTIIFPLSLSLANYSRKSIFLFSTSVAYATNNTVTYGVGFSISLIQAKKEDW